MKKLKYFIIFISLFFPVFSLAGLYPQHKNVKEIFVINLKGESFERKVLAASMQGIVNKDALQVKQKIYLVWKENNPQNFWLRLYKEKYNIKISAYGKIEDALKKFKKYFKGYVIYTMYTKKEVPSINIATTISAMKNVLVVEESLIPLMKKFKIPLYMDLRGKYKKDFLSYKSSFDKYYNETNKNLIGILSPDDYYLRDFLIQNNVFTFYGKAKAKGRKTLNYILPKLKDNIPVFGYLSATGEEEFLAVTFLSYYNKFLIPSDTTPNLSVHCCIKIKKKFSQNIKVKKNISLKGKLGVVLAISDGDNLTIPTRRYIEKGYWVSKNRGKIPFAWSISLSLADLAPAIAKYYVDTQTENDELVGMIGVGYASPSVYKDKKFFIKETNKRMKFLNIKTLWAIDFPFYNPKGKKVKEILKMYDKSNLSGILVGYDPGSLSYSFLSEEGIPFLFSKLKYKATPEDLKQKIKEELKNLPSAGKIVFYSLSAWSFNYDKTYDVLKEFLNNEKVVFLKPSDAFYILKVVNSSF